MTPLPFFCPPTADGGSSMKTKNRTEVIEVGDCKVSVRYLGAGPRVMVLPGLEGTRFLDPFLEALSRRASGARTGSA
jgi:hypothetical protein